MLVLEARRSTRADVCRQIDRVQSFNHGMDCKTSFNPFDDEEEEDDDETESPP
ncbi:hypothetical protein YC2023_010003 [Brassica napus]